MKRTVLLFLLLLLSSNMLSQEAENNTQKLPSAYGIFSFPIGTKIVLELKQTEEGKYEYRVISYEVYDDYYSFEKRNKLFALEPVENTIELFFVGAYYKEGKDDKDYKTLLKIRNNLKVPLNYKAEIKYYYKDEFESTSIVGIFPGTETEEIWQHKIDFITLYDFEILRQNKE